MINKLSSSSKSTMFKRIMTAIILLAILIPCLVFGDFFFFALIFIFACIGIHEAIKAPGPHKYPLYIEIIVYLFVLSFIFWPFIRNLINQGTLTSEILNLNGLFISLAAIFFYILVLFLIAIYSKKFQLSDATYLLTVSIVLALGFQSLLYCRYLPASSGVKTFDNSIITLGNGNYTTIHNFFSDAYASANLNQKYSSSLFVVYLILGTWGADVGAYFFGVFFGKHRMNPRISPHKTWEGFIGGAIFSILLSLGFAAILEYCFNCPLIPGLMQFNYSPLLEKLHILNGTAWPFITILSILMPIIGNIGGFAFSLIKRQFGIKDFGFLFPGHGGIIDRFDSVFTNATFASFLLMFMINSFNIL